jgi:hypothetical protein
MAILNKRISSATLPQLQNDARLGSIIRDVASAPATENAMYRTINPSVSTNQTPSPAYVSQLTSALREMQPQNYTSMVAPTRSNNVSLMSSQMPDMSGVPNISKGPITSITQPGDTARQKIGSTTSTSGGIPNAVINALAGAVMGLGAQKIINSGNKSTTGSNTSGTQKPPVTSTVSTLPKWAEGNLTITDNKNGTYTQKTDDGSTLLLDKDGKIIKTTDANGDIFIDGETHHDNGNGTYTITSKDGSTRVVNETGEVIDLRPAEDKKPPIEDPIVDPGDQSITDKNPPIDLTGLDDFYGKRGGLAVMMKNGGVAHFDDGGPAWAKGLMNIKDNGNGTYTQTMDDGSTVLLDKNGAPIGSTDKTPDPTIDPVQSLLDLLKTSGGAAGAGGVLAALLSSTGGSSNNVNTGLDMSTYGLLNPRTTNFGMGPARYVPHSDYSQRGSYTPNAELLHNLNAPASNPVNEGDYKDPYITNRPGTNNGMTGGTDINAIIAQIVNAMKNKQLASQVSQASTGNSSAVSTPTASVVNTPTVSTVKNIPSSSEANTPTGGGFVAGGGSKPTDAQYAAMVAQKKAEDAAQQAKLDAFHISPNSRFYQYQQNPSSIPHLYGETDAQAFDRVKRMAFDEAQTEAYRSTLPTVSPGGGFVVTNGGLKDANGNIIEPGPDEINTVVQNANGTSRYMKRSEADAQEKQKQQYIMDQGSIVDPTHPWNVAASDDKIKAAQNALAQLSQTPGDDKTRQAALKNFLTTTTFTPEQLAAASNGMWAVSDLKSQMAPVVSQPSVSGVDTIPRAKAQGFSASDMPADVPVNTGAPSGGLSTASTALQEKPEVIQGYPTEQVEEQPQFNGGYPVQDQYAQVNSGPTPDEIQAMIDAQNASLNFSGAKKGGAIHKATGGLTHYTYGKPADVLENLGLRGQQMAQGGLPHVSNVPIVEGRMDFRQGSAVHGEGDGQSDDIPAMLADGEYVIDAETVAQIGNGSTKAGAQALDKFRESIRAHKRSAPINKIPPKTKALTSYLKVK